MKNRILFIVLVTFLASCVSVNVSDNKIKTTEILSKKPKNIILLIGDGMGLSQVTASYIYNVNVSNFDRFSTIGLIKTGASSDLITDSAASATAYATGIKTYNEAIGMDRDSIPIENIVEKISKKGIASGVISTSGITHATPACFYAHVKLRKQYDEIAAFLPTSGIDFFAGGGLTNFNNRADKKDLLLQLTQNNFEVTTDKLPIRVSEKKQAILLAEKGMPKMIEDRGDFLPNATKLAMEYLSKNEAGFFLMVEGSQIDWGGHSNEADYLISEQLDFDKTIGVALDFAKKNGETLVIVTADHETGGFTLGSNRGDYNKIQPSFSTDGHSATMVPIFAKGPGEVIFGGIYENTQVFYKMMQLYKQ